MASAPERISIKRRRADEPVDHLFYQSKKQRTTNHVFVRVATDTTKPSQQSNGKSAVPAQTSSQPLGSSIPIIKPSQPGDEIRDFQKYRATHGLQQGSNASNDKSQAPLATKESQNMRKFHLTRDLSTTVRAQPSSGISKAKSTIRPHLPTFVERHVTNLEATSADVKPPVDRIIRSTEEAVDDFNLQPPWPSTNDVRKEEVPTFSKPAQPSKKTGRSIHDDPTTWDIESDQLADELAALAFEMDPDAQSFQSISQQNSLGKVAEDAMLIDDPEEYIYETYIRLERNAMGNMVLDDQTNSFGYLVIDEEHEDLWEQYLRDDDDDDDEWDEEDEDSNAEDNPRNEYPDEELSSDDERGTNIYRYRRHKSDDEQYDEEDA